MLIKSTLLSIPMPTQPNNSPSTPKNIFQNNIAFIKNYALSSDNKPELNSTVDFEQKYIREAKIEGKIADTILNKLGTEDNAKEKFKHVANVIIHRRRELKNFAAFIKHADIKVSPNNIVLWTGDKRDEQGNKVFCARATAENFAQRHGGKTLRMTPEGAMLDGYSGHQNSAAYIQKRFNPFVQAESLREKMFENEKISKSPPPSQGDSVLDVFWDTLSAKIAHKAEDQVILIHAAPNDDPFFESSTYKNTVWKRAEEPNIKENVEINKLYEEDLSEYLKEPSSEYEQYNK